VGLQNAERMRMREKGDARVWTLSYSPAHFNAGFQAHQLPLTFNGHYRSDVQFYKSHNAHTFQYPHFYARDGELAR
jgi:hypothetical protein